MLKTTARSEIYKASQNVKMPKITYRVASTTDDEIVIKSDFQYEDIEVVDAYTNLVNMHYKASTNVIRSPGNRYFIEIDQQQLQRNIDNTTYRAIIDIWLKANNKKDFRRTAFSKKANRAANNRGFSDLVLELYCDAYKYGLTTNTMPKPIIEFIAKQFEKGVERCRL